MRVANMKLLCSLLIAGALAALCVSTGALAQAHSNPAKDSGGQPGYQNFCKAFKADCNANNGQGWAYTEKNPGTKNMGCKCVGYAVDNKTLKMFNDMCINRGLAHSWVNDPASLQRRVQGGGGSACWAGPM